jgi:DNA-binding MarR family transcriptional regulator
MNRERASKELMESFIRMVHQYNALEKHPVTYGTKHDFHHSERHMLDIFGDNPAKNMSEIASMIGVTKGAVSQFVSKLEKKGTIRRLREPGNHKEVLVELTPQGKEIYQLHQATNQETISDLLRELRKYPSEKIDFLLKMFKWLEDYLEMSETNMKLHSKETK